MFKALENRIRKIIEGCDKGRWPLTRAVLWLFSMAYGVAVHGRVALCEKGVLHTRRLPYKVIAVGNLTTGGTGKTPMVAYLARHLQQTGKRVVVISRGYKGKSEKMGGLVSDGRRILMGPDQAGDEPFMMANQLSGIPVYVGRDRYASGIKAAQSFEPDVAILDDGYQHMRLYRDLNILLFDARKPFGNGHLLPRGKLREPISAARRADVAIFTRSMSTSGPPAMPKGFPTVIHTLHSTHSPILYRVKELEAGALPDASSRLEPIGQSSLAGQSVYAFSGIADNESFRNTLEALGLIVSGFRSFPDHYRYSERDQKEIISALESNSAKWLATTEKDYYRFHRWDLLPIPMLVVGVEISFASQSSTEFEGLIEKVVG